MEIFRVPPYQLSADYTGLTADTDYTLRLFDTRNEVYAAIGATSNGSGAVSFDLPDVVGKYDGEYKAIITAETLATDWTYESTTALADYAEGDVVTQDSIKVVRPYLIPADITPDGSDVNDYIRYERIARTMIDNIVGGFYFVNKVVDRIGMGNDKIVLGERVTGIISVTENNVLSYTRGGSDNVFDVALTSDHQSMIVATTDENNLIDSRPASVIPIRGDFSNQDVRIVDFPTGYNYTIRIESGWPYVPQDIKDAVEALIDDQVCQTPNYFNRYIREYETKDFRVDVHRPGFAGTGNLFVDQILQKYLGETLYNGVRVL